MRTIVAASLLVFAACGNGSTMPIEPNREDAGAANPMDATTQPPDPTELSCAMIAAHGIDALQGPFEGRLVVLVLDGGVASRAVLPRVAGAIVRVEKEGTVLLEASTDQNGCVELVDGTLTAPFAVHIFTEYFHRSMFNHPQRIQIMALPIRETMVVDLDAIAAVEVRGLDRVPPAPAGEVRAYSVADAEFGSQGTPIPITQAPRAIYTPLTADVSHTLFAFGGWHDELLRVFRPTHLGVAEMPAGTGGSTTAVTIELDHPIDRVLRADVPGLPDLTIDRGFGEARAGFELPDRRGYAFLGSTFTSSNAPYVLTATVPLLEGSLAGSTIIARAEAPLHDGHESSGSLSVYARAPQGSPLVFAPWPAISAVPERDGSKVRLQIDGFTRCDINMLGVPAYRAFIYGGPWEAEPPEPPAGFQRPAGSRSVFITCIRHRAGEDITLYYAKSDASLTWLLPPL